MLSLVIPVYRNEESLPDLLEALTGINNTLQGHVEMVFVVDGSPDRCYEVLRNQLPQCDFRSKLVLLSRNFGSFAAIRVGLEVGDGDHFAVMAADLQEPPELILKMQALLDCDAADVVTGVREARMEPLLTRLPSAIFWWFYRRYVVPEVPPGGVDVFACNRHFRDTLLGLEERHSSLIAQIFWLGFRREQVSYTRLLRKHGTSAWTLRKKVNYLMDSIFAFSDLPIRLLLRFGGLGVFSAVLGGAVVFFAKMVGAIHVPGYTMTMLAIIFFGALNLLGLGIVGSYAWRAYENTKARPQALQLRVDRFNYFEHHG